MSPYRCKVFFLSLQKCRSRRGKRATRVRACLNTRLGILSLTGLATHATPRTNGRHLRHLPTDKFMIFPYSIPIPWNFHVEDNRALPNCQERPARVKTIPTSTRASACLSALLTFRPNDFNENWYCRVIMCCLRSSQYPITNQSNIRHVN
jgi:hypothetical protein